MTYLGRIIVIGRTHQVGDPFLAYGVSGRSLPSRQRRAIIDRNVISILPNGEITREQEKQAALLLYDAIFVNERLPFAIVSNGRHTGTTYRSLERLSSPAHSNLLRVTIETKLNALGPESDKYNTPRIVGAVDNRTIKRPSFAIGIIAEHNEARVGVRHHIAKGENISLSTYSGKSEEPSAPRFSKVWDIVNSIRLRGNTAQALADSLSDWVDPDFLVCTAATVWHSKHGKWELAVRNEGQGQRKTNITKAIQLEHPVR